MRVNQWGIWKNTTPHAKVGGVWVAVKEVWVKKAGAWVKEWISGLQSAVLTFYDVNGGTEYAGITYAVEYVRDPSMDLTAGGSAVPDHIMGVPIRAISLSQVNSQDQPYTLYVSVVGDSAALRTVTGLIIAGVKITGGIWAAELDIKYGTPTGRFALGSHDDPEVPGMGYRRFSLTPEQHSTIRAAVAAGPVPVTWI